MAWILQSLLIVIATTASKCKHNYGLTLPQYDYDVEYGPILNRPGQPSYLYKPRMIERSAEASNGSPYSAYTGTQRVQEQEWRRIESRIVEPGTRTDGSYKILNYPSLSNRRGGSDASSAKDRIVFPGPTSAKYQMTDIPEQCQSVGICDDVPNYPTELVKKALAERPDLRDRFQIDQLDVPEIPDIAQRIGPSEDEQELCNFTLRVYYPKGAVDKDGKFYYIMNDDNNPLQGVKVEICNSMNNEGLCSKFANIESHFSSSKCHQKHFQRKLWAIENDKVVEHTFPVPSCCSCVLSTKKTS